MASIRGKDKAAAFFLLVLNLILYFIVLALASWAVNHMNEHRCHQPATSFLIMVALIAGVVGFAASMTGIYNVKQWDSPNLQAAGASSLVTWLLTLLAMGLAWKEKHLGWIETNFRTLEMTLIFLSGTQFLCTAAIHIGVAEQAPPRGRN